MSKSTTAQAAQALEDRIAQAREARALDALQGGLPSAPGPGPSAFFLECEDRQIQRQRAAQHRREAEAEAARQRAEANAPLVAKLVPVRERLRKELDEARELVTAMQLEERRRFSEWLDMDHRIANLEAGTEGAQ